MQKICKWCGGTIVKLTNRSKAMWERQQCCSVSCSVKYRTHKMPRDEWIATLPAKACKWCDKDMSYRAGMSTKLYFKRETCSTACATSFRWHGVSKVAHETQAAPTAKLCPHCGKEVKQRPGEPNANFKKRNTCGRSCAGFLKKGVPQSKKTKKLTDAERAGVVTIKPGDPRFEELRKLYEGGA